MSEETDTIMGMTPLALAVTVMVLLGMFGARFLMKRHKVPPTQWGSVLVSMGILGTFTGIIIALWNFDAADIQSSVPELMAGMRSAFVTSAVGMLLAVWSKLQGLLGWGTGENTDAAESKDYFALLTAHKQATEAQTVLLEKLRISIAGEGDGSLLTATTKNRDILRDIKEETQASNQALRDLRDDLKTFTDEISNKSTDAIIEALEKVVQDFNATINEQFGENFKQLNEAVGNLLVWMKRHKELVEKGHEELTEATRTLQETRTTLEAAAEASQKVAASAAAVTEQVIAAIGALDKIRGVLGGIEQPTTELAAAAQTLSKNVQALSEANQSLETAMTRWTELAEGAGEAGSAIVDMTATVKENSAAVATEHKKLLELIETGLEESGTKNRLAIENQIKQLDKALQDELKKAMDMIGGKLGSLSKKFADDYGPLTAELAKIVALARDLERAETRNRRG